MEVFNVFDITLMAILVISVILLVCMFAILGKLQSKVEQFLEQAHRDHNTLISIIEEVYQVKEKVTKLDQE